MTPAILDWIRSIRLWLVLLFDLMRIAVLETAVSIGFRPAALMVSPDSVFSVRDMCILEEV
jgi:hypothetical protein